MCFIPNNSGISRPVIAFTHTGRGGRQCAGSKKKTRRPVLRMTDGKHSASGRAGGPRCATRPGRLPRLCPRHAHGHRPHSPPEALSTYANDRIIMHSSNARYSACENVLLTP